MELGEQVGRILAYGEICDHCLGRFFGKRSFGLSNEDRGHALRVALALGENTPYHAHEGSCWICHGLFDDLGTWAGRVAEALSGIEHATFLVGTRVPPLMAESEELVWSDLGLTGPEPLKSEMNREVGKLVAGMTGKAADLGHPDVVAILDLAAGAVGVEITPLFFRGRYRKLERGIPQTRWPCRACHGAGCERCNFTGKMYPDSVEELIGRTVAEAFRSADAVLHGAGREDIDARMLGTGRPFVMEVVAPRVRTLDLPSLEAEVNRAAAGRVGVSIGGWATRDEVETLKSEKAHKKYRISVEVEGGIARNELETALDRLRGAVIAQRTPARVVHRRADRIRERRVVDARVAGLEDGIFFLDVVGEAGLYVKELVSGDGGRTRPSLAGILGRPARVIQLDVLEVEGRGERE
ncbi:MAG TPA: tRNA pseudouridine(54/55) synthase Pus10 [Methanomicrobiales archaeon]|nr:tRNA pseudouridine(54/55) synthase Pus10 [Methanomicrobiales archaeon]